MSDRTAVCKGEGRKLGVVVMVMGLAREGEGCVLIKRLGKLNITGKKASIPVSAKLEWMVSNSH